MSAKSVTPALGEKSFSCPHCRAIAHQTWYQIYADECEKDAGPSLPHPDVIQRINSDRNADENTKRELVRYFQKIIEKDAFIDKISDYKRLADHLVNVYISKCYSCGAISIWISDRIIYPENEREIIPNSDMPSDVRIDFVEASNIVDKSPRGASALLRLCVQKLMPHLGCKGKNVDDDIGRLVANGLDKRIQQSLDVVRVIGNNAVHPGQIDLRDDKATAMKLFGLVNLIVEALITMPKHITSMYESLPEGALKAIEKRDGGSEK